jgi:hypothetical protein
MVPVLNNQGPAGALPLTVLTPPDATDHSAPPFVVLNVKPLIAQPFDVSLNQSPGTGRVIPEYRDENAQ